MHQSKYHPTCHQLSLTVTAKIVAFFDMVFGLFGLVWFVLMLSRYDLISLDPFENIAANGGKNGSSMSNLEQLIPAESPSPLSINKNEFAANHKIINLSLVAFYTFVNIGVFILLLYGVYKKSPGVCLVWFYIRCAIFVFKTIILIMYLIGGRPLYSQVPFIISMIAHLYGLWVVNCYVDELNANQFEESVKEAEEKRVELARESCDTYDVPNGIEKTIEKRRLEAAINGIDNHSFTEPVKEKA